MKQVMNMTLGHALHVAGKILLRVIAGLALVYSMGVTMNDDIAVSVWTNLAGVLGLFLFIPLNIAMYPGGRAWWADFKAGKAL